MRAVNKQSVILFAHNRNHLVHYSAGHHGKSMFSFLAQQRLVRLTSQINLRKLFEEGCCSYLELEWGEIENI